MVSGETERWPHLAVPEFWSTQFGTEIKRVGVPSVADEVVIAQGSVGPRRFLAVYGYKGRIVGGGRLQPEQVAGVLRAADRAGRAVPAGVPPRRPSPPRRCPVAGRVPARGRAPPRTRPSW